MSGEIMSALIGALSALGTRFVSELLLKKIHHRTLAKDSSIDVFRRYADPLAISSENLLWRFSEIFSAEGWGSYLKAPEPFTKFENYKKLSTLYRLAVLLAWLRALRRELAFLSHYNPKRLRELNKSIRCFEKSLADGPHVELERIKALCKLWEISPPINKKDETVIGREVEILIKKKLMSQRVDFANKLELDEQINLCRDVADIISNGCKVDRIPEDILMETKGRAIRHIAVREAWLYRDWQSGIGDLLLRETENGIRKYEVIGYREFERMMNQGSEEEIVWLTRLNSVLEHLNVFGEEQYDARIKQVKNTMMATAHIVLALSNLSEKKHKAFSNKTIKIADDMLNKPN